MSLRDLYQQMILDHSRRPQNFCKLVDANRVAEGFNPLCGDKIQLYLRVENDKIGDASFECSGCAISKASASLMTAALKGKTENEAKTLIRNFRGLVTGETAAPMENLGKLSVFSGVSEFPARVKCATLAWHTLQAALDKKPDQVTTES